MPGTILSKTDFRISIHCSLDALSAIFPTRAYNLYMDGLISRIAFLDKVLFLLNQSILEDCGTDFNIKKFIDDNGDYLLPLNEEDYNEIERWIQNTQAFKVAATYRQAGLRHENDIIDLMNVMRVKSLTRFNALLDNDNPNALSQAVSLGLRNVVDLESIRQETKVARAVRESQELYYRQSSVDE